MMDQVLWWTGLLFWVALALCGLSTLADWVVDKIFTACDVKREFFAFVAQRAKAKQRKA